MNQCNNTDIESNEIRQHNYNEQVKDIILHKHRLQLKQQGKQNLGEKDILDQSKLQIKDSYKQTHLCTGLEDNKTVNFRGADMVNSIKLDDHQQPYHSYTIIANKDIQLGCKSYISNNLSQNMINKSNNQLQKTQIKIKIEKNNNNSHDSKQNRKNFIKIISKKNINKETKNNPNIYSGDARYLYNSLGCRYMQKNCNPYPYDADCKPHRKSRKTRLTITLKTTNPEPMLGPEKHNTLGMGQIDTPLNYLIKLQRQDPQEDEDQTLWYPCAQVKPYSSRDHEQLYKFMI